MISVAHKILQSHLVGTPDEHVAWLLEHLEPARGGLVVDAGCGVGEVSRGMAQRRPDLRFLLVNTDESQLALAPEGKAFSCQRGSYARIELGKGEADAVMFCYSLGYQPLHVSMREAARALRAGGKLLVYEPFGEEACVRALASELGYSACDPAFVRERARQAGFRLVEFVEPKATCEASRKWLEEQGEGALFERSLGLAKPYLMVFQREDAPALERHTRIGLQFSGGKDSLACAELLKGHADRITVYHVRVEPVYPETQEAVDWVSSVYPRVEIIQSQRQPNTIPSDVVSVHVMPFGRMLERSSEVAIIDRYTCCFQTIMAPVYDRMLADGVTLVVRGQKLADHKRGPIVSGHVDGNGTEYLFPIESWSAQDVFTFLRGRKVPIPRFYDYVKGGLDCWGCTAWLEERRMEYLSRFHPEAANEVRKGLRAIQESLWEPLKHLRHEANYGYDG